MKHTCIGNILGMLNYQYFTYFNSVYIYFPKGFSGESDKAKKAEEEIHILEEKVSVSDSVQIN